MILDLDELQEISVDELADDFVMAFPLTLRNSYSG